MPPVMRIQDLRKFFPIYGGVFSKIVGWVKAVHDISLEVNRGEVVGLVGESGCGKTTAGRMSLRLIEPTSGRIEFDGQEITGMGKTQLRRLRPRMQMIFQDPYSSLNPLYTVERIIGEAPKIHQKLTPAQVTARVEEVMEQVGLSSKYRKRYAHEFSGGQRQRIGIARAIALNPEYIVCDEPISALDVSIQAQIINLLQKLQREKNIALLFISHDLNVVKHISQRIAVMYLGKIVETAPANTLNSEPAHPYTRALLAAKPSIEVRRKTERIVLRGDVPSPINPPSGCAFHPRCPEVMEKCKTVPPETVEISPGHTTECHLYETRPLS